MLAFIFTLEKISIRRCFLGFGNSLIKFLPAGPIMQLIHNGLLGCHLGFRNFHLILERIRIKTGKDLVFLDRIPFLDQDFSNAVTVLERKGNFPQIDISIEGQRLGSQLRFMPLI